MAELGGRTFNSEEVDPGGIFEIIPEGWYVAQLVKSDYRETKAGDGHYVALQFQILTGEHKGRMVFTNLNIDNKNPAAVEIAERNFSQLCHAVNVPVVQDTEQLHDIPLQIKVGITPAQGNYEARNDIKGYKELEETPDFAKEATGTQEATTQAPAQATAQEPKTEGGGKMPPWMKKGKKQ